MTLLDPSQTFLKLGESVGLDDRLRKAVARVGHIRPTLVQSKCLPLALTEGRDLLVRARTGSGKTLAYCLPLLQKILRKESTAHDGVKGVVLVPTKELCTQVERTLRQLTYYCHELVTVAVLTGGRARSEKGKQEIARQHAMLRDNPNVVVATPGGLLTHIRTHAIELKHTVETLVVDEADLVLSFGYTNEISEIMKSLPKICQGFLMSATLSPELNSLKNVVLHSPAILKLEEDKDANGDANGTNGSLTQFFVALPKEDKWLVVYVFLKLGLLKGKGLFFVNATDSGYALKLFLEQFHIRSAVLNGELPLRSRLNIIEQYNVGNFDYLIATDDSADVGNKSNDSNSDDEDDDDEDNDGDNDSDNESSVDEDEEKSSKDKKKAKDKVETTKATTKKDAEYGVSRGLDFRNVSFVVNVDFPPTPKSYTHRVGRTARGGAKGVALSLVEIESASQTDTLIEVQKDQPRLSAQKVAGGGSTLQSTVEEALQDQVQPSPLEFDLTEIEGFRYRVQDVSRAVTKTAVREARAAELKAEILNSERLQNHFDKNPSDLQILQHDRLATHRVQEHLRHVPKYLLPRGMQVANLNKKRKKKRARNGRIDGQRRKDNDPLQSFDSAIGTNESGGVGGSGDGPDGGNDGTDGFEEFFDDGGDGDDDDDNGGNGATKGSSKPLMYSDSKSGTGRSSSGRDAWKKKHKKGKYSGKRRKTDPKPRISGV